MIPVAMRSQPNDVTCGPTCLHAVYQYYKDNISLEQVIKEVHFLENGGTLAVHLATHALKRGYNAQIYTYNLKMFDPSWLLKKDTNIIEKLYLQKKYKHGLRFLEASKAYIDFLNLGGKLFFEDLTSKLLKQFFKKNIPILAGLSATYLYQTIREYTTIHKVDKIDDVRGHPTGHFVVLCGYSDKKHIIVADPYEDNPFSNNNYYVVNIQRLINSIMLGIITYDANILIIKK